MDDQWVPIVEAVFSFADQITFPLAAIQEQYNWRGADYRKTLSEKEHLRRNFLNAVPQSDDRTMAICHILAWGAVRGNASVFLPITAPETARASLEALPYHSRLRIASWSKLLGIVWPEQYAIYDSRVAVALNGICRWQGIPSRFAMPVPRSPNRQNLIRMLQDTHITTRGVAGYFDQYLPLLHAMQTPLLSMADIEMWLFMVGGRMRLDGNALAVYHHEERQIELCATH